ncbi:DedA family protein, partial [Bacillus mobilis]
ALIWISVFIGLGWKLGEKWRFVEYSLHHYGIWILFISVVVTGIVWFYIKKKKNR